MIKIAFCDDDLSVLNQICMLLDKYRTQQNLELCHTSFQSPLELIAEIERGARYDIIFLDVLMPGARTYPDRRRRHDGTLLATYGKKDGITLGEMQECAKHVLRCVMALKDL